MSRMSVAQLKRLLDRAGIPHADCLEKAELRARLVKAVEVGTAKNFMDGVPSSSPGPRSQGSSRRSSVSGDDADSSAAPTTGNGAGPPPAAHPTAAGSPVDDAVKAMAKQAAAARAKWQGDKQRSPSPMQPSHGHHSGLRDKQAAASAVAAKLQQRYESPPNPKAPATRAFDPDKVSPSQVDPAAALDNWLQARTAEGQVYYYHRVSRAVRWEKPDPEMARKVEARIIGEKLRHKRRHAERVQQINDTADRAKQEEATKDTLREEIESRVASWARGKTIGGMLQSLPQVIAWGEHSSGVELDARSSAAAIKKAYLKAVRVVHPDKVATAPLQQRLEAQRVFAVLQDAFKAHEDGELPPTFKPKGSAGARGGSSRRHTTRGAYHGFAAAAAAGRSGSRQRRHTASASAAYAAFAERSAASGADPPHARSGSSSGHGFGYSARVPPSFAGAFARSSSKQRGGGGSQVPGSRASFSGAAYKGYGAGAQQQGGSGWKSGGRSFAT